MHSDWHLHWFRSDLRTTDNSALHGAAAAARAAGKGVAGLYVISPGDWTRHHTAACRVEFVLRNLAALSGRLKRLGIPLLIRTAPRHGDVAALVVKTAREVGAGSIHFNIEYEVNERARDAEVERLAKEAGVSVHRAEDQCIIEPGAVLTQGGTAFSVFSPFKRQWMKVLAARGEGSGSLARVLAEPEAVTRRAIAKIEADAVPQVVEGFVSSVPASLWPAGEEAAMARLESFAKQGMSGYKADRNTPSIDGTSSLSPYLAAGVISPRQCLAAALAANAGLPDSGNEGVTTWISELVWRDFYKHVLHHFPRVCMHRAFKPATDRIRWRFDQGQFDAWRNGQTGYPIVDAAMRQLLATGWMHNRLRMIVAMFFTKDLFFDWRLGEEHFMRHLIDGDLASNNGGWQWSASTGTDAAPYFRIFNPTTQSQTCDPKGTFIRTWVPELAGLSDEDIHNPDGLPPLARGRVEYPARIVDHAKAKEVVMGAFRGLGGSSE